MADPSPGHSVTRNLLHASLSWIVPVLASLAATPLIVRAVGAEAYGLYALALGLGGQVLGLGLGRALARHVAAAQARGDGGRISALVSNATLLAGLMGLFVALALGLGSAGLSRSLNLGAPLQAQARAVLLLTALGFPLAATAQVWGGVPLALRRIDLYTRVAGSLAVGTAVASVLLARQGFGVVTLVVAGLAGTVFACLAYFRVMKHLLPAADFQWRLRAEAVRELTRFAGAVLAYQACGALFVFGERVYLTRALGPGALTLYVVPMSLAAQFHAFVATLSVLLVPLSSAAASSADAERLRVLYERGLRFAAALSALFIVITVVAGRLLLTAWMGAPFAERAAGVLALHALSFGFLAVSTVPWHLAEGLERPAWNAALMFSWLLLTLPLLLVLTPAWGLPGAAAARLAGLLGLPLHAAWVERAVFGSVQVRLWGRLLARLAVPSLVLLGLVKSLVAVAPAPWSGLLLIAALAPPAFMAALWVGGYFPPQDRTWLVDRLGLAPRKPAHRAPGG